MKEQIKAKTHMFAICAYKDSPYLEECIRSLKAQSVPANMILCTSTPSEYIYNISEKYNIILHVRQGQSNIRDDWNFAYEKADADLVTIAHQDDIYEKDYLKTVMEAWEKYPDTTVFTTDSVIVKNGKLQKPDKVELVKKLLRMPLRISQINHIQWIKELSLRFGNPIICPSCTYHKLVIGTPLVRSEHQFALDWDNLYQLSRIPGRFICVEHPLIFYRVHDGAATKACIENHSRIREETEMYRRFWPEPIVKLLMRYYQKAYDTYR